MSTHFVRLVGLCISNLEKVEMLHPRVPTTGAVDSSVLPNSMKRRCRWIHFVHLQLKGLAIVTAEDALGTLSGGQPSSNTDEALKRLHNSREALDVFGKVRESLNDGSVYFNMGHCYYLVMNMTERLKV